MKNTTTIVAAVDAFAVTSEVEELTRCETPRAPLRQAQTRAQMRLRLLADHLDEVLWRAEGAAAYARWTQRSIEEANASRRLHRELELLWHSLLAHANASLERDAEVAHEARAPRPAPARHRLLGLAVALLVGLCTSLPARAWAQDPYQVAMSRSVTLERSGRYPEAARALARIAPRFPQDFRLALRLGWLWFQARVWDEAERAYRRALALSGADPTARAGLAWSLLRQRRREAAAAQFRAVLAVRPDDARARQGLALSRSGPTVRVEPSLRLATQQYSGHPTRDSALGMSVSLPVVLWERLLLAATYRFWSFRLRSDLLGPGAGSGFSQHEGHFALGWTTPGAGVAAHYSLLEDGSGEVGTGHVAGLSARWSPWGDLLLDTSLSRYPDLTVARAGLSWSLPLGARLRLVPGVALQRTESETLVSGSLSLVYARPTWSAWLGGKVGDEIRPAVLSLASVANLPERILGGGWAGIRVGLGRGWSLFGAYGLQLLATDPTSAAHSLSVGLSWQPVSP